MSSIPSAASPPSGPSPPLPSIGCAVDAASVSALCSVLSGLSFPLSPSSLSAAVSAVLQLPSYTRATQTLHCLAVRDRAARNAGGANSHPLPQAFPLPVPLLLLPPSSPSSPFFSPLYADFFDAFFTSALQSSLANPLLCGWCLDVLTAGQDSHSFLTHLKQHLSAHLRTAPSHSPAPPSSASPSTASASADSSDGAAVAGPAVSAASSAFPSTSVSPLSPSCGRAFAEGELAYTCTQCQMDPQWSAQTQLPTLRATTASQRREWPPSQPSLTIPFPADPLPCVGLCDCAQCGVRRLLPGWTTPRPRLSAPLALRPTHSGHSRRPRRREEVEPLPLGLGCLPS